MRQGRDGPVWGSDWPHPRPEGPVPNAKRLVEVFLDWTPDKGKRQAILFDNPARLYGFA
ncbi:MAG TPA: amidohydrolase family protein [Pseudolabrys sp.]|nr:amidohydrolase family protein [Pseudolabrys sp.]